MENEKISSQRKYPVTSTVVFTGLAGFIGGSVVFGWNITCMSVPAPYIKSFMNDSSIAHYGISLNKAGVDFLFSVATLLFTVGGAIGAFFAGKLADKFGRKRSVLLMQSVAILGALFYGTCQIANSLEILMAARFLVGLGAGACFAIVPMYASEIAPAHVRGGVATCTQLFITVGIFLATCFVLEDTLGSVDLWPFGASSMLIFNIISIFMLLMPMCVESPKWLLNIKKDDEGGRQVLKSLTNSDDVEELLAEIKSESEAKPSDSGEEWGYCRLISTKYLRWPVSLVVAMNAGQQFSGINVVFFFAASLYQSAGLSGKLISYAALSVSFVNVVATMVSTWLVDKLGRRPLILFPMVGMVVMMGLEVSLLSLQTQDTQWMSYACIACMVIYVICFAIGLGPIPLFIGSELLRPEPRASAMSLGGVVNLLGTLLVALLFENVMSRFLGHFSFVPFMIITTAFVILFWIKLPETKNRSVTEIYREMGINEGEGTAARPATGNIELEEGRGLLPDDKGKNPVA